MAELTPIPAEHRRVYYDALRAGRAEAERLGYPVMDDRIFGEFFAVIRSGLIPLIAGQVRQATADDTKRADEALRYARLTLRSIADVSSRQAICRAAENAIDLINAAIARRAGAGDGTA